MRAISSKYTPNVKRDKLDGQYRKDHENGNKQLPYNMNYTNFTSFFVFAKTLIPSTIMYCLNNYFLGVVG